jgi:hypothetical protein
MHVRMGFESAIASRVFVCVYLEAGELMRLVPGEKGGGERTAMLWLVINVALIRRPIK